MKPCLLPLLLVAAWCVAGVASGATVYKSVDDNGNVTYSRTPPPEAVDSKRMEVHGGQPNATATARLDAEKRNVERSAEERIDNEKASREASDALAAAKQALTEARKVEDDDWFGTYGPYRRLKPAYYQRVRDAERVLAAAERAVAGNCGRDCPEPSWTIAAGREAAGQTAASVRHSEEQVVELDAEGRRVGHAASRREVQNAQERQEVQRADERNEVWNAKGRTAVGRAEERHAVD